MASSYKRKVKIVPEKNEKKPVANSLGKSNGKSTRQSVKLSKATIAAYRDWAAASNRSLSQQMEQVLAQAFMHYGEGKLHGGR